jgi:hypothetical protein
MPASIALSGGKQSPRVFNFFAAHQSQMYAPDSAVPRLHKLSPTAIQLYLYHCQWRDHETGYSRKSKDRAAADLKLSRTTAYRAYKKLSEEDFITETPEGRIGLRGGSFAAFDKTKEAASVWQAPPLKAAPKIPQNMRLNFEQEAENCFNFETDDSNNETESGFNIETNGSNFETNCFNIETAHNRRARASIIPSINLSISDGSDTHTLESQPAREDQEKTAPAACVCVSEEITFQDYREFARSTPGFTKPDAWATIHFNQGDEPSRILVREWLASRKPEAVEARAAPSENFMPYGEALNFVGSFVGAGHDAAQVIGDMQVTEDVRARLIERFCNSPPEVRRQAGGI